MFDNNYNFFNLKPNLGQLFLRKELQKKNETSK